jgi:hypothetical protein
MAPAGRPGVKVFVETMERDSMIAFNVKPRHIILLALSVVGASAGTGCGRIPGQFEIFNNQIPTADCQLPIDQTVYRGEGRLDLSLVSPAATSAYFVFPLVRNNLDPSPGGIDVNQISVTDFAVDITPIGSVGSQTQALFDALTADGNERWMVHTKSVWSGSLPSGGGMITAKVNAVPVELANRLRATQEIDLTPSLILNLRVRAFGHTRSKDIESDPFDFPVSVCDGCLVANVQPCPFTVAPTNEGNACNVAQDSPVDCCLNGNNLVCPPSVVAK